MKSKEVTLKQPFDIEQAILTARGFEVIGVTYMHELYRRIEETDNMINREFPFMAMNVNLAIALELNLKILYYFDKGHLFNMPGKMHSLSSVYKGLSENIKKELLAAFNKLAIDVDFHKPDVDFGDVLERYFDFSENICVNWRYYGLDENDDKVNGAGTLGAEQCLKLLQDQINKLK